MVHALDKKSGIKQESSKLNLSCINGFEDSKSALERITTRTTGTFQKEAIETVTQVLLDIEGNGDQALIKYTKKFDGFETVKAVSLLSFNVSN